MGWLSFPMHEPVKDWFKRQINPEHNEVIDMALVHRQNFYAALKNKETGQIFCVVLLIRWSRSHYNFSYKDMDEFCGPSVVDCPMRILNILTPLTNEDDPNGWAREWRERVRKYHDDKKKIKTGIVKTSAPVMFTSGAQYQYFQKVNRRTIAGRMENGEFIPLSMVRINLAHHNFEIL